MPDPDRTAEGVIREAAYFMWEREGRPAGRSLDHWVHAIIETRGDERRRVPGGRGKSPVRTGRQYDRAVDQGCARRLNHVPLRRPHRGFRPAMVRASPAAIQRSGDDTDESLSLAAAGFGFLAVARLI